ncbi:MAG TPA: SPOR domain-containing protein [Desulfuromonadales bacterium]|nr:SPOR domain-containing protein [Desulfuromonadales bacterium]
MRIDYSEPKKSYVSTQAGQSRTRKESPSSNSPVIAICITAVLSLSIGFGSGWMFSQRAAKKGFEMATKQKSLESSNRQSETSPTAQQLPQPMAPPPSQVTQTSPGKQQAGVAVPQSASPPPQGTADPQLSFYKTLPSGQKSNVIGSGINSKEEKPAKQTLQAAIPSNVARPTSQPQQTPVEAAAPPVPTAASKGATKTESGGFVVQAASHSLKSEAETLRSKLASKGYNAYISESQQGDKGTWYRVRVGKKLEQDAAKELAGKLGKGAIVVPDKE